MNLSTKLQTLRKELLTICDNVQDHFIFPEEYATFQNKFPYITFILGDFNTDDSTKRMIQDIHIIGIITGENDLLFEQLLSFEETIFNKLYKNANIKCIIEKGSNNNLFKPFGLDAGLYPPYAGVRFELKIPFSFGG